MQVVIGEGPVGAALIDSPIDKLIFTGSVATGKRVGEAAARRLLPVVLELGGKDPDDRARRRRSGHRLQRSGVGRVHELPARPACRSSAVTCIAACMSRFWKLAG